jgi:hypothetical protein
MWGVGGVGRARATRPGPRGVPRRCAPSFDTPRVPQFGLGGGLGSLGGGISTPLENPGAYDELQNDACEIHRMELYRNGITMKLGSQVCVLLLPSPHVRGTE